MTFSALLPAQTNDAVVHMDMWRKKLEYAEAFMRQYPQIEPPVTHYFSDGVYAREMRVQAGTWLTGKIHKYTQINILSQGEVSVLMEDGIKRIAAPYTYVSPPGTKRTIYGHTDYTWTTIHGTELTDLDEIESYFLSQTDADYLEFRKLLLPDARDDYRKFVAESGFTESQVRALVEDESDQVVVDAVFEALELRPSEIEGQGLFALRPFSVGEPIAIARLGGKRTGAGRYANHSPSPNAMMVADNVNIVMICLSPISVDDEVTVDYRQAAEVNKGASS